MAVAASNLTTGVSAVSGTTFTTASIAPTANNLILLTVVVRNGASTAPGNLSISGNSLTWVKVASVNFDNSSSSRRTLFVYRALGASPTTGTIVITTAETDTNCSWIVDQFSGVDTSGTNGSGAVVQSAVNSSPVTFVTSLTATLAAFGSTDNATFGALGNDDNTVSGFTVGSGFTQMLVQPAVAPGIWSEFKATNDTTVDFSFGNQSEIGVIGIEIKATGSTAYTQTNNETITISEPSFIKSTVRIFATETVTLSEVFSTIHGYFKTLSETITLSEVFSYIQNRFFSFAETVTLSEVFSRSYTRILSETVTLSEVFSTIQGRFISLVDTLNISDTIGRAFTRIFSETSTISEVFSTSFVFFKNLTDTITMSDTIAIISILVRNFTDTITMQDWLWRWAKHVPNLFSKVTSHSSSWSEETAHSSTWTEQNETIIDTGWT